MFHIGIEDMSMKKKKRDLITWLKQDEDAKTYLLLSVLVIIMFILIISDSRWCYIEKSNFTDVLDRYYPEYTDFKYADMADYLLHSEKNSTYLIKSRNCDAGPSSFIYKKEKYYICDDKARNNKSLIIVFKDEGKVSAATAVFLDGKKQKSSSIQKIIAGLVINSQGELEYLE